jgi:hypothetical protein
VPGQEYHDHKEQAQAALQEAAHALAERDATIAEQAEQLQQLKAEGEL